MKQFTLGIFTLALLTTSCGTSRMTSQQADGIMTGVTIGATLGNAIGGLLGDSYGGWDGSYRGSAIGTILGTVAGAAIGHAATTQKNKPKDKTMPPVEAHHFSPAIDQLRIQNIRYLDDNDDQIIQSRENCKIMFEIINKGQETAANIIPVITEMTDIKQFYISPSIMVEEITPHNGIKYTANIRSGKKLQQGEVIFRLSVCDEYGQEYDWQEFAIPTER